MAFTVTCKPGTLVTTATTVDQVIVTYTVTAGSTFCLTGISCNCRLTTFAATATNFGTWSLETPSGTKIYTGNLFHSGNGIPEIINFNSQFLIPSGSVVRLVCTPSTVTSFTWQGNILGYESN